MLNKFNDLASKRVQAKSCKLNLYIYIDIQISRARSADLN